MNPPGIPHQRLDLLRPSPGLIRERLGSCRSRTGGRVRTWPFIAGDVHMPPVRALDWLAGRLPGVPLLYAQGNHDFWWDRDDERYILADQLARCRELVSAPGIHLLCPRHLASSLTPLVQVDPLTQPGPNSVGSGQPSQAG
jgi:hypothetical protein